MCSVGPASRAHVTPASGRLGGGAGVASPAVPPSSPARGSAGRARRRDRHGRGLRGPLAPPEVPLPRSRSQRFDDLVLDAVERLERRLGDELSGIEFAVEEVPGLGDWDRDWVPLGRSFTGAGARPPRVVVYRRPIETRVQGERELRLLVHDVVVEEVADLLGRQPEDIDPDYGRD